MTLEHWQQVKEILAAALEREPAKRQAYLDQVGAEPSLRREVESLISAHEQADGSFMEHPAVQSGTLKTGTKLGTYEILAPLGAGGMGEVYRAHDSKLRRDVAIKVLPTAFVHDPERLSRFQREARMLASLNHPNIATIYGLEYSDGVHYLAMELVPGQTLAEKVSAGPLRIAEALAIASQIAEALEAAHEKGVIHRDLKPANVKVTPEGNVKVLDFGLAKAFANDGGLDLSQSPTLTGMASEEGRILGTPAYMSPEQARGKPVDKRTDIWAFGCVLYELLAGRQAFRGDTLTDTLAAILEREPDWQSLPATVPPSIRALLRRCLQKDLNRRARDAGDMRIEIEETLASPSTGPAIAVPAAKRWTQALLWGLTSSIAVATLAGVAVWKLKPQPHVAHPVTRMAMALPPSERRLGIDSGHPMVALSPDGDRLVGVARRGGTTQLYIRELDQFEFRPMPGTEDSVSPFFSPDSHWIGFFARGQIKKVSVSGGTPQIVCDAALGGGSGASWGPNDTILFSSTQPAGRSALYRVSASGGKPQVLAAPDPQKGETDYVWPELLPNGKEVLFSVLHSGGGADDAQLVVQSLVTGERRVLIEGGTQPRYVPTGHLVYLRGGTLMAAPFDLERSEMTGTPVPIVEGIMYSVSGAAQFSFSDLGSLVYISGGLFGDSLSSLAWVDRKGTAQPLAAPPRFYTFPRLSPDGQKIAVKITAAKSDIWVYDLTRQTLTRLTSEVNHDWPIWTPDGKRVTFTSNRGGHLNIFWKLADGSGAEERLTTSENQQSPRSWSPDGQTLVFTETSPATGDDIWVLRPEGDRKPHPFLQTSFREGHCRLSPDGRWLAYMSDESGQYEIYVQPFPGPGGRSQISTEGGTEPVWNRNGRELFYRHGDKMTAVDITTQPTLTIGKPHVLFEKAEYVRVSDTPNYDVSLDGQHFLMVQASEQQSAWQLNVVLNWFEELKRRVPEKP